jgi:hypothetical protein
MAFSQALSIEKPDEIRSVFDWEPDELPLCPDIEPKILTLEDGELVTRQLWS